MYVLTLLLFLKNGWAVFYINNPLQFTGGSDGGVYCWEILDKKSDMIMQIPFQLQAPSENDFPRSTSVLTPNHVKYIMVTTDKGYLSFYDLKLKIWKNIHFDDSYSSYCVSSVSFQSKYIALGGMHGDLTIFHYEDWSSDKYSVKKFKVHEGKLCAVHWVDQTNKHLLTCGLKGQLVLWKINACNEEFEIKLLHKLHLPKCKPHWWSTVALYTSNFAHIIVGDRGGSINLYSILENDNSELNSCMKHHCIHGENGVTDIQEQNSLFYSAGRDGKVVVYSINKNFLDVLHTIKTPHSMEWIGRMVFYKGNLLLLGFYTKYFLVWSSQCESSLMEIDCGGGHRSWDFFLDEKGKATFVAIKKKDIVYCEENLHFALNKAIVKFGISGQEFTSCCYLFTTANSSSESISVFACGGEDTTLRILGINNESANPDIISLCNLSGHLSSIRSFAKIKLHEKDTYLLISVGGRAQMKIWSVKKEKGVKCKHLFSYMLSFEKQTKKPWKNKTNSNIDPQMRFMDVSVNASNLHLCKDEMYNIAIACSDSFLRVYSFNIVEKQLSLCYSIQQGHHCILKIISIEFPYQAIMARYFITGSTDGKLRIMHHKDKPFASNSLTNEDKINHFQIQLHKSGINSIDAKNISGNMWLICCGGDDNALSATLFTFENKKDNIEIIVTAKTHISAAHSSQITGVKIIACQKLVSVSIDQRVNIWEWSFVDSVLKLVLRSSIMSLIPDIAHLDCWPKSNDSTSYTAVVCGQGIEYFDIENIDKAENLSLTNPTNHNK